MTIQQLDQLVNQLAQSGNIKKTEIIDSLSYYAQLKYGNIIFDNERKIIDKVKKTIIKKIYRMRDHSYVSSRPDYQSDFGFDKLEMDVLKQAAEELENEGLIVGNENYIKLKDKGIFEAKRLNGDL